MTLDAIDINGCRIACRLDGAENAPVVMLSGRSPYDPRITRRDIQETAMIAILI
jgi:hypothetical protein